MPCQHLRRLATLLAALEAALDGVLGYDPGLLLVYRCVHSLLIGNAHDGDPYGRDSAMPLTAGLFNSAAVVALLAPTCSRSTGGLSRGRPT